ncbi:hypothetical protein UFOVP1246_65 [uncultured Caudovirales phage]|uniref:Uncharacterized protein n=1 Tax=uncultured Caudovirales phage TaxID=2100421 RepID=A0A6J5RN67_9CAUD|nr:hypothetical protein UFOVP1246_65 [uncultured Caudovirales phage]
MSQKATQRQIVASVRRINGYFAQVSGGEISSAAEKVFDGGSLTPETLTGVRDIGNVTVTRPYSPVDDAPVLRSLRSQVGRWRSDIIVQDCDTDLVPIGQPRVYNDAVLIGLTEPDGDAASGSAAHFSLTFSVGSVGP